MVLFADLREPLRRNSAQAPHPFEAVGIHSLRLAGFSMNIGWADTRPEPGPEYACFYNPCIFMEDSEDPRDGAFPREASPRLYGINKCGLRVRSNLDYGAPQGPAAG